MCHFFFFIVKQSFIFTLGLFFKTKTNRLIYFPPGCQLFLHAKRLPRKSYTGFSMTFMSMLTFPFDGNEQESRVLLLRFAVFPRCMGCSQSRIQKLRLAYPHPETRSNVVLDLFIRVTHIVYHIHSPTKTKFRIRHRTFKMGRRCSKITSERDFKRGWTYLKRQCWGFNRRSTRSTLEAEPFSTAD